MSVELRVYTASRLTMAPLLRTIRNKWAEIDFTASWVDMVDNGVECLPEHQQAVWYRDLADVARSNVVMVVPCAEGKPLRGALVEVGYGLGLGKQVIVVGDDPSYGTWHFAAGVHRARDLNHARELLWVMAGGRFSDFAEFIANYA